MINYNLLKKISMAFSKRAKEELIWPLSLLALLSTLLSVLLTAKCRTTLLVNLLILGLATGLCLSLAMISRYAKNADGRQKKIVTMIIWLHLGLAGVSALFQCTIVFGMGLDVLLLIGLIFHRTVTREWLRWSDLQ